MKYSSAWKEGFAGGYGSSNNPQILLQTSSSGEYKIEVKRQATTATCGIVFFVKTTTKEEVTPCPSSGDDHVITSPYIIYTTTSATLDAKIGQKYIIIPALGKVNEYDAFTVEVTGPGDATMKEIDPPNKTIVTSEWTKELSGGYKHLNNPQFEIT
jgi:hypothetical protein